MLVLPVALGARPAAAQDDIDRTAPRCSYSPYVSRVQDYANLVTSADPYVGNPDAPVTVVEYIDPNCGHCKHFHPVMKELMERYGDVATFYVVPFVIFPFSLPQVEALYVAAAKGKYYEMLDAQFDAQTPDGLDVDDLTALAVDIGIDPDWLEDRMAEGRHQQEIANRRREIIGLGIPGTPALMINGRFITDLSNATADCIGAMIEAAAAQVH
jgi:protein-disulfide isomerase